MTAWASAHNGGKTQVGLASFGYGDFATLNLLKQGSGWLYTNTSTGVSPADLDSNGYPTVINNGGVRQSVYLPDDASRPWSGRYVLTWTGGGTVSVGSGTAQSPYTSPSSTGRIEFIPTAKQITVTITATPVTDLKLFYKADESLINAGETWNPTFLAKLTEAKIGVIRFMDWLQLNGTSNKSNVSLWAHRKPLTYYNWQAYENRASLFQGTASYSFSTTDDYSVNLGSPPTDKQTVTVLFANSATTSNCTFSVDGGATKHQILRSFGDTILAGGNTSYRPASGRYGTLVFDADLQAWIKFGGDSILADMYLFNGMPLEACVDLCAIVGAHPHFPTPHLSLDPMQDWVSGLATYIRDTGPSWMIPRFEGPNELWMSTSAHNIYANAKQLVHNGGALPGATAVSYTNITGFSYTGVGAAGSSTISIGAHSIPVGATVTMGTFGGLTGFANQTPTVTAVTSTSITVNRAPNSGTWTSGGSVTPTNFDTDNWYGMAVSKIGQAVSVVYGNDRSRYRVLCGVQTASSAKDNRLASPYYAVSSGNAGLAAKYWVTSVCCATYMHPSEYTTNQELVDAYAYNVTYAGNPTQQAAIAAAYTDTLASGNDIINLANLATLYANWKTWAQGFGVNNLTAYEGGYSPDYTSSDATAAITGATKDAAGCVLTVPNTTNSGVSNSNSTTSAFAKNATTISIAGVSGMGELNGNTYTVIGVGLADGLDAANKIRINVDSSAFNTFFTSSGSSTVTLAITSPGQVTWTSHGKSVNAAVTFSVSGGSLPTGLTAGTTYYVKTVLDANTFTVSATPGGTAINFTGSVSGTVTCSTPSPVATLVNSKIYINQLRYAGKYAPKLASYLYQNYKSFFALTGGGFVAEFPSQFLLSNPSKRLNGTGNIGDSTNIWGSFDADIYQTESAEWTGIKLYNAGKRRFIVAAS